MRQVVHVEVVTFVMLDDPILSVDDYLLVNQKEVGLAHALVFDHVLEMVQRVLMRITNYVRVDSSPFIVRVLNDRVVEVVPTTVDVVVPVKV